MNANLKPAVMLNVAIRDAERFYGMRLEAKDIVNAALGIKQGKGILIRKETGIRRYYIALVADMPMFVIYNARHTMIANVMPFNTAIADTYGVKKQYYTENDFHELKCRDWRKKTSKGMREVNLDAFDLSGAIFGARVYYKVELTEKDLETLNNHIRSNLAFYHNKISGTVRLFFVNHGGKVMLCVYSRTEKTITDFLPMDITALQSYGLADFYEDFNVWRKLCIKRVGEKISESKKSKQVTV